MAWKDHHGSTDGSPLPLAPALLLPVIALGGCASIDMRPELSGKMGCPPEDIVVHDGGNPEFTAECHDELFYCSTQGHQISCAPERSTDPPAPATAATRAPPGASRPGAFISPPPIGAGGFTFGTDAAAASKRCTDTGQQWDVSDGARPVCSGTPASIGMDASARLQLCEGKLCSITLLVGLAESAPATWLRQYLTLQDTLAAKYGAPTAKDEHIGSECADNVRPCLESGKISLSSEWRWGDGHAIRLTLGRIQGAPSAVAIGIAYSDRTLAQGAPKVEGL